MDPRTRRTLRQHLHTDALLGVDAVPIAITGDPADPTPESPLERPKSPVQNAPKRPQTESKQPNLLENEPATLLKEQAVKPLKTDAKLRILNDLSAKVAGCTDCGLAAGRTQTVFGEGNPDAEIMFIGEGPGQNEDEQGRPFVGRAGGLLDKQIAAMGLERSDVYIANVVKCRPPGNRNPAADEVAACSKYLQEQILTIQPKVIITLGGPAAKLVLETSEGITRLRGTWHEYRGVNPPVPVMPTFHPAYLLRAYTVENRKLVWSDLLAALERVGRTPPTSKK
ncbi:uracil-DNA glycosylase [Mucisphaera sp.]|uniref:uracil-DNA glycosylase n=1 Tax=Mucisphaera sp. TaxID=2913024 RepID=UPI003D0BFF02